MLKTDWALTVLVSLQPISTKYSRDADAHDQWTRRVNGSTCTGQYRSVQFMCCEQALSRSFTTVTYSLARLTNLSLLTIDRLMHINEVRDWHRFDYDHINKGRILCEDVVCMFRRQRVKWLVSTTGIQTILITELLYDYSKKTAQYFTQQTHLLASVHPSVTHLLITLQWKVVKSPKLVEILSTTQKIGAATLRLEAQSAAIKWFVTPERKIVGSLDLTK